MNHAYLTRVNLTRWFLVAASILSFAASNGCSQTHQWLRNGGKVGPNYKKPAAPVADQWIDFNDRRVISQDVNEHEWWRQFNDPVIDRLVQDVYRQNLPLRAAAFRVREAQAQRGVAVGNLFPQQQEAFGSYSSIQLSKQGNAFGLPALPVRRI